MQCPAPSITVLETASMPMKFDPCSSWRTKGLPVVPGSLERVVVHAKLDGVAQN